MDRELYEQQQAYLDNVVRAEVEERPLVSARLSTAVLAAEFGEGVFAAKVASLRRRYEAAVFVRRDGNCFVRAFVLGVLLHLRVAEAAERARLTELFKGSLEYACSQGGYEQFILEDFHDVLMERLAAAMAAGATEESVLEEMRTAELSDYCVMFMRCLVGAVMCQRQDQFLSFLPDVARIRDYVKAEIEPMGREVIFCCLSALWVLSHILCSPRRRASWLLPTTPASLFASSIWTCQSRRAAR